MGRDIIRVASGTDGIDAYSGGFYAQAAAGDTVFTRLGGYANVFPSGGFTTEIAIYPDPSETQDDTRFAWTSAVSQPDCAHRRDFVFSVGSVGGTYCVSASNNSPGNPCDENRDPVTLTQTGWYRFRHEFHNDGSDVLAVDMTLFDAGGDQVGTWNLSDATDVIGDTVGGNRYGWFPHNEFAFVAIDSSARTS